MGQAAGSFVPQAAASIGESANAKLGFYEVDKAADDLTDRQNEANALYRDLYRQTQADYAKYDGGGDAYQKLLASYGVGTEGGKPDYSGFESSPDYLWAQQQGIRGRDMSAASTGRLYSGAYDKALAQYNQGLATQNLDNYRRGLYNSAGMGLQAKNALTNYRAGYGNQLGGGITNLGDIAAAEHMGMYAVNSRYNSNMQNIWGTGGGGQPSNQNALNNGGSSSWAPEAGSPGSGSYTGAGSSSYQFNPWGG